MTEDDQSVEALRSFLVHQTIVGVAVDQRDGGVCEIEFQLDDGRACILQHTPEGFVILLAEDFEDLSCALEEVQGDA